ncbi:hypothetical protein HMPREF0063_12563 [Aeromicrobium marinum DSM 15272]|uniref:Uncharacterized protein n=1 Tax=Aeromicrobium marinum DSM 15272 TaxID=585531 RepID=E2SEV4_9ACTN|nr:hypothetical protein [Aeromicrobium marinum]EFQ82401.1 hypothetical protein HMPREF0063_12563 [Aeromicrobium marinum DSM 15272]
MDTERDHDARPTPDREPRSRDPREADEPTDGAPDPESALAVNATPDEVRLHGDADETGSVQRADGSVEQVEPADESGG